MNKGNACKVLGTRGIGLIGVLSAACLAVTQPAGAISFQQVSGPFAQTEAWGASWGDFNNDRCPDLFINHHRDQAGLYKNNCDGTFKDVTSKADPGKAWLDSNQFADQHGASWGDFDHDGDEDLFVTTGARWDGELMVNQGDGVLINRTAAAGLLDDREGRSPLWIDYNNDGYLDLFMQSRTRSWSILQHPGNGTFTDSASTTGFNTTITTNYGHLIDLDNDGTLDYLGGPEGTFPTAAYDLSHIPFRNIKANIPAVGPACDSVVGDFNGDQRNDVLLVRGRIRPTQAKQFGSNVVEAWFTTSPGNADKYFSFKSANGDLSVGMYSFLGLVRYYFGSGGYHPGASTSINSTSYRFTLNAGETRNQGIKPHSPTAADDRGVYIGYNPGTQEWEVHIANGGQYTTAYIVITSSAPVSNLVVTGLESIDGPMSPVMLLNNGQGFGGTTQPLTQSTNLGDLGAAVSCDSVAAADFDNDMDLDIYMVCRGGVENIANRLYANRGNGQFDLVANAGGAAGPIGSEVTDDRGIGDSVVVADYDGDGKVDLFVTNGVELFPVRFDSPDQLYRNTTATGNHWIELDLAGTASNTDGVGAKVYATAGGVTQLREQNGGNHRWSQNYQRIHFGLAGNTSVNLRVEWPSGLVDTFNNVGSNHLYRVTEGGPITQTTFGPVAPDPDPGAGGGANGLSVADLTVNEAVGNAQIQVTLSPASSQTVTVNYATKPGTALGGGKDYKYRSGTLTFNPGDTGKTVSVPIVNDSVAEPTESFTLHLSGAVNAPIADADGTVTITDND